MKRVPLTSLVSQEAATFFLWPCWLEGQAASGGWCQAAARLQLVRGGVVSYLALTELNCAAATHDDGPIDSSWLLTRSANFLGYVDVPSHSAPLLDPSFSIQHGSFQRPGCLCL